MLKKMILSFTILLIIVYILACAWAMDWIDNQKIESQFFTKKQKSTTTLNIAKVIWQVTPAFNREKDAERALKISRLYISYLSVYSDKDDMMNILKNNYNFISSYYKKNEYKLSDKLKYSIIAHRFLLITRSLGEIKEIDHSMQEYITYMYPKTMQAKLESIWFYYFYANCENCYTKELEYFNHYLQQLNEKENTTKYNLIGEYNLAVKLCYDKYLFRENAEKNNIESQKIFQQLQQKMTPKSKEYVWLDSYLEHEVQHASTLFIIPLISSNQTECEKEVKNFADKMVELANN
ncbi:MAG: hypothetical protein IJ143_07205 [Neisseriaceae bacterium]|nr:hypothetical protein [Neisseriaceae bacterium]